MNNLCSEPASPPYARAYFFIIVISFDSTLMSAMSLNIATLERALSLLYYVDRLTNHIKEGMAQMPCLLMILLEFFLLFFWVSLSKHIDESVVLYTDIM